MTKPIIRCYKSANHILHTFSICVWAHITLNRETAVLYFSRQVPMGHDGFTLPSGYQHGFFPSKDRTLMKWLGRLWSTNFLPLCNICIMCIPSSNISFFVHNTDVSAGFDCQGILIECEQKHLSKILTFSTWHSVFMRLKYIEMSKTINRNYAKWIQCHL